VLGHVKAASGSVISGAQLAENWGVRPPYEVLTEGLPVAIGKQIKLACMLAELEGRFAGEPLLLHSSLNQSFHPSVRRCPHDLTEFAKSAAQRGQLLEALRQQRSLLPLADFLILDGMEPAKAAAAAAGVARCLPGVYTGLILRPDLEDVIGRSPYAGPAPVPATKVRCWAEKQAEALSLEKMFVDRRVFKSALRGNTVPALQTLEKSAAVSGADRALAEKYALYKLSLLECWDGTGRLPELAELIVRQNYLPGAP
jgi:hypothetical protein